MGSNRHVVPEAAAGERLDRYVATLPGVGSRAASERLLAAGAVLVTAVSLGATSWGIVGAALGVVLAQAVNCLALLSLISWTGKAPDLPTMRKALLHALKRG